MDTTFSNLAAGPDLPGMDPVRKYVLLVLWQATKDGASELIFGGTDQCADDCVPIKYRVQGAWYAMTPFPASIRPDVQARLCEMAGIPQDSRFPWEGSIEGDSGGVSLRWRVLIPSDTAAVRLTNLRL